MPELKEKSQVLPRLISNGIMRDWIDKKNSTAKNDWNSYQLSPPESINDPNGLDNQQGFTVKSSVKLGEHWGDVSFQYRKNITINSMKVDADLQDFPLLIDLYDSDLHLDVQADGDDILFTDQTGVKLDHELEYFSKIHNSTHAHLVAWVRIPTLSSTINTTISMYYGNHNIGNQENPTGVWDSNYLTVLHLNESVTDEYSGETHYDSTVNQIYGIQEGNNDYSGKICVGQNFDGINDEINIPPNYSLNPSTDVTISGWFKLNSDHSSSSSTSLLLLEKFTSDDQNMAIILTGTDYSQGEDGTLVFKLENGDKKYKWTETRTWSASVWYYFTCVLDTNDLTNNKIYINGLEDTDSIDWSNGNNSNLGWNSDWNIGGGNVDTGQLGNGQAWFNGIIDEIRISSVSRPLSWIKTEYNNQYDPRSFFSIDKEEEYFGGSTTGFRTYHGSFQYISGIENYQEIGGTVDPSHAFLIMYYTGSSSASHPREHQVSGYISSPNHIKFDRVVANPNVYVSWWIVESPEIYVQRGSIIIEAGKTSSTTSVSMVDPSRSLVIGHSRVNELSATQQDTKDGFMTVELQNSTTVIAQRAVSATGKDGIIRFQVIEWPSRYTVYSGEVVVTSTAQVTDLIAASGDPNDPVINMSSSWVYFTYDCTDNGLQQTSIFGQITDTNEVTFGRYDSSSYTNRIRWYVVQHPPERGVLVQRGDYTWDPPNSGTNILKNDIPIQVDPDRAIIVQSSSIRDTGLTFPRQKNLPKLISESQWTITQYLGTTDNNDEHKECWQIISFSPPDYLPPVVHDVGVDDPGNGLPQFWANVSDDNSNVESVTLNLNQTLIDMILNETGFWVYQPSSINFNDFFSYQIHNSSDSSGNYLIEASAVKNITFNYDTVFPNVLDWEYYRHIGNFGTFKANVTDSWGEIDSVIVNVTQCAGTSRNDLTAIMKPTISGYINDTLQMNAGTILFEIKVNDTSGNSYTSSKHQGEVNAVPIASNLTLSPFPLHSNNMLSLNYNFYDQDDDNEEGTEIRWYKNSVLEPSYNDMTQIPAYTLIRGDIWCVSVQPKDGKDFGELIWSHNTTVYNAIPEILNYYIAPDIPTTDSILSCFYSYHDSDNDDENINNRQIRWYKNGQLIISVNDQIFLPSEETTNGETWVFSIRVHDGINYSNWVTSDIVTIANTAPVASDLNLAPNTPNTNQDLIASYTFIDPDGDEEIGTILQWYKNGIEQPEYENQLIVPASATNRGENWYFTVLPNDGIEYGSLKTSSMINIVNTAPSVSNLSITPNMPKTDNELIIMYSYMDIDLDPESGTEIIWYKNGVLQGGLNYSNIVPVTYTAKGQVWYCKVRPSDGTDFGEWTSVSTNVTIGNTGPSANDLTITPANAKAVDDLMASFTSTDPDSDPVSGIEILWYSDGILQEVLNGSMTVPASYTLKGQEWHYKLRLSDGMNFSDWINLPTNITIINTAPFANDLTISPIEPTSGDELSASYSYTDPDSDLESGSFIRWYKNGEEQAMYENQTKIPSIATNKGENWYFTIQPCDNFDFGILKISLTVTILNTEPSVSNLIIIPNEPKTEDNLSVSYIYIDLDSDPESGTEILWYKDGLLQGMLNGSRIVPACYTAKGQEWYYKLRPSDGSDFGIWVEVLNNVTIGNTAPFVTELVIIPENAVTKDDLIVKYTFIDPDFDINTGTLIRWYKDDVLQEDLNDSIFVPASFTAKRQEWYCMICPSDGINFGKWVAVTANITIGNTVPTTSDVIITPSEPKTDNDLFANYIFSDPDGDQESGSYIRWYKNGNFLTSYINQTIIPDSATNKGETWYFTIQPSDGTDFGSLKISPFILITNTEPSISEFTIIPGDAQTEDDLTINYTYIDPDNDLESDAEVLWYKDGVLQGALNGSMIVSTSYTAKGEVWCCKIRPSDDTSFGEWYVVLNNVTIQNTSPSVDNLLIIPNEPQTNQDLSISYIYADIDSDLESSIEILWYRDGLLQGTLNGSMNVLPSYTDREQVWHCKVRSSDGIDFSTWIESSINVTIHNTPPKVSDVKILENSPVSNDSDLHAFYSYSDYDNDIQENTSRRICWYKNGILQETLNDSLVVDNSYSTSGDIWFFIIQVSDGKNLSKWGISPSVSIEIPPNALPEVKLLHITPENPNTSSNLNIHWTFFDEDGDNESGSEFYWYCNGVYMEDYDELQTLPATATIKGEIWHVKIRPRDGIDFGNITGVSINVTIGNSAPSIEDLVINPVDPVTSSELSVSYYWVDPDINDVESDSNIIWYKDGVLQGFLNGSVTINSIFTVKGQVWHCKVQPSDGSDFGEWIGSIDNVTIKNTPPFVNELSLLPSDPRTEEDLSVCYTFIDYDSDSEIGSIIRWYKNGEEQTVYENQTTIFATNTNKGEIWYFTIRPSDGANYGNMKSSSFIVITNTEPSTSDLYITPGSPRTEDDLTIDYIYMDVDGDPEINVEILWYENGILNSAMNGSTRILASYTNKGQIWYCKIRVSDGTEFGDWLGSQNNVTIDNTAPIAVELAIIPNNPRTIHDISASYVYSDLDSDPESGSIIRWYKNDLEQVSYENQIILPSTATSKGESWYFTILPSDGINYGNLKTSPTIVISNTAPLVYNLSITPRNPVTGDALIASYSYMDVDGDLDSNFFIYWFKNGEQQPVYENQTTIPAVSTSKGETWYFTILPSDGTTFGNLKSSLTITIENTAPSISNVSILPNEPQTYNVLTVSYSFTDADDDNETGTEVLWYRNGILQGALNGSKTVSAIYTAKGEVWNCMVRPSDGIDYGEWVVTPLNVTISNTAPSANNLVTIPSKPNIGDDLIASYNFQDPDADPESKTIIRWYKNGIEQFSYENETIVPSIATNKGENWYFTLQPSDGIEYGTLVLSSIITIGNTAPVVSDLLIIPNSPRTGNDLTASYNYNDLDSDLERGSIIRWFKNNDEQISYENQTTIPASTTNKGENWYFTILPCDGDYYGYLKMSPIITILNTKPIASELILSPNEAQTDHDLIASYIYADADMDPEIGTEIFWYKNGVLQGALNGSTTIAASYTTKGEEWHLKIRPSDGTNFGDLISVSVNVTITNTAPSTSNISIEPADPKTMNDIIALYIYTDPDLDPESGSIIRWYKNGIEQFDYENDTFVPSIATSKGENWYFTLQPSDGIEYGLLISSPIITIGNTAPSVCDLLIMPNSPRTGNDLTASYSYNDLDSDLESGSIIYWFKDGVEQFNLENMTTIPAATTNKEENWYFSIQPYDGTDYGNLQSSSIINIVNTAPSINNLVIIPSSPFSVDEISLNYVYIDEDSDSESGTEILWYRDGVLVEALEDFVTIPSSYTAKGQVWHCKVRPSDGTDFGEWEDSSINVTIVNMAPFTSELVITPSEPKTDNDLFANYIFSDLDNDIESGSIIRWYKNGIEQYGFENLTILPATATKKGENWYFIILPSDGTDYGDLQTSPIITIVNTSPSVSNLAIIPSEPRTGDTLTASYSYTDPDFDLESGSIIRWYKNGIEQPEYENQATLPAAATSKGETWYFTLQPSDGTDYGDLQTSPLVTIANTSPSVSNLAIIPSEPRTGDTLTASYSYTDPDFDLESGSIIRWYKNGIEQPEYENQATLPAAATSKGESWYFTLQPSDGSGYGDLQTSPMAIITNTSPSASNLDISPNDPQTPNDLFAFYIYSDPDSDPENGSRIRWYKNAIEQSIFENQTTIPAAATSKGENWYFTILPNDGSDYGTLQTSQIITIMNTAPSVSDLNIIPSEPETSDDLEVSYTYIDPDDDPETGTKISWYKDGVLQGGLNDSYTVLNGYTAKGQVWHCKVRPSDGTDFGEWISSTVNITINNTAPTITDLSITPAAPKTGDDLLGSYTYSDLDMDPENGSRIQWYKNGIEQSIFEYQTTIPAAATSKGEEWYFTIQANDGTDYGNLMTSPIITIRNTAPSVTNLIIIPSDPMTGDDLTAVYNYSDVDTDPESGSRIQWYKNGIEQSIFENQTIIPAAATSKGENWFFTITPSDGSGYGSQKSSSIITILNTAPSASDVYISPTNPQTGDNLVISYSYTDPDNDLEVGTEIVWYKDNILQDALNGLTVVAASYTAKGQEWYCKIRPSDGIEFGNWESSQFNITITNTPPSVSDLSIVPSFPTSSDSLTVSYSYLDVDSDEENGTEIVWYKDGVMQGILNGSTSILVNLTEKGDVWHFKVRPKDGFDFGEWTGSPTNVTIRNTPPTVSNVKILEETPVNETLDLHATYIYSDFDGDPQVNISREIRWYRDNILQSSLNDILTVGAGNTSVGQIWYFTIRVSDGVDQSILETSPSVGIQIPPNNPPEARFLNFIPSNPIQADSLYINWTFHDIDGDEELGSQYRWYRNGDHISEYDNLQTLPSTATVKGDVWHVKIRPRDGKDFGNWVGVPENVTIHNTAPSISGLVISPNEPKTEDEIFISYSYIDPDLDPENGTEILWYKDGELQRALNGCIIILSTYTTKGQVWHCKVRPSDGTDFGEWVESIINITIINTAPSVFNLTITPSEPKTGNNLTADYAFIDADMDPESKSIIYWFKNGLEQLAYENQTTIPASVTNKGENWQFSVKPSDGSDYGNQGWSSIITIANTAPLVSNLTITPTNPMTGDDLIAIYDYFDADSDLEIGTEIIWYRDNVLVEALNGSTIIFSSYTNKGQVWHYKVHPKDGFNFGQWVSVSINITINNTAPSAENLIITPSEPQTGNDLEAKYTYLDIDMDPESGTQIIWYKDGELQGFLNDSKVVFSTYTAKGQVWGFKVKPSDGTDFGNWISVSINITVLNTEPLLSNLTITPSNPKTGDDLNANYNYFDIDSDLESGSYIRWYKNGEEEPSYVNQTIIPTFATTKGDIWYFSIKPSDGSDYGILKTSPNVLIANTAPWVSNLTITPDNPQTNDDLVASYVFLDVDMDSESGTEIIWYKNGVIQTALNGSITVNAEYTARGQVWFFKIHPSDNTDFGEWVRCPVNVTINNTAPYVSDLTITPNSPKTNHDLKANYIYTDVDTDLERQTEIVWYKNGVLQTALNGSITVGFGNTSRGDIWHFKVHPFDGTDYGIWFSSPINVTIHNTSPTVNDLEIIPVNPKTGDDITAFYLYTDIDTDPEHKSIIRWFKNSLEQYALENQTIVFASSTSKGETWYFVIEPCDGSDYGNLKTSPSVIIDNTAPFASDLIIIPSYPKTEHDISITYNYSDVDSDLESGSYIRWYKNGEEQTTYENQTTIPAFVTTKGETWHFTIEPSDGFNFGNLQTSPIVTIMNTAPSAIDLTIIPNTPMTGQSLMLNYTYYDVDLDPENGTEILWYKDGVIQEILSGSNTVAASFTTKGQVWHCKIKPSDGSDFGYWIDCLKNVTIGNSAPTAISLTITPTSPKTVDNLTASYIYYDPDDPEGKAENGSEILWYKDGVLQVALNNFETVPANYTARGQIWHFKVRPKDGVDFGSWSSLLFNVTILNTESEVTKVGILPSERPVYTNDTLEAIFEIEDIDNDQIIARYIVWINNSVEVPSLENNTKILPEYTKKGQIWSYKISVFDGFDWSDFTFSSGRYIENSVPQVQNVNLIGGMNTSNDIIVTYDFHDEDGDIDHSEIIWRIIHPSNGSSYFIEGTKSLSSSNFVAGDIIWVIVTPSDGWSAGQLLDRQKIVGNAIPQISTTLGLPEILSDHPEGTDKYYISNLNLIYVNYSKIVVDIDAEENLAFNIIEEENHDVIYAKVYKITGAEYRWYKYNFMLNNWELQENLTSSFIRAADLKKGERWIVSVRPKDTYNFGAWVNSSSITIANSYPRIEWKENHPEFIVEDENLAIGDNYYYWEDYDDDEDLSYFWWYRNGVLQEEYNNTRNLPSTATLPGEEWKYVICPFDGTDFGENCTSPSIIIESKAIFNNYTVIPQNDTEGHYMVVLNITDSRNIIQQVEYILFFNNSVHDSYQRGIATNEIQNIYILDHNLPDHSYLNTITIIKIEAITHVIYSDTLYTISSSLSFNLFVKDEAPPRIVDTLCILNSTNLMFYCEIEEYGSGIADVTLYYCFEPVEEIETSYIGGGASIAQTEHHLSMIRHNKTITSVFYIITIPFHHNKSNWKVIYRIISSDNDGNSNKGSIKPIVKDLSSTINDGLILQLDSMLIPIFALLVVFFSVIVLIHRYRQKSQTIQLSIVQKYDAMKSVRVIFCRTSYGVQFYNERTFHGFEADIDILSGLSAAISDFMRDITAGMMAHSEEEGIHGQKAEFEALNRKGLNMLVWNGRYSSIAIISDKVLPKSFRAHVRNIGQEIEDNFADRLGSYMSPNHIPVNEIRRIIHKHLPLYYCSPLALNGGIRRREDNILSRKEQRMWKILNQKIFSGSNIGYSFPEAIVSELGPHFKRIEVIKFLKKAVKLKLLVELSQPHSINSSNQSIIAERIEE